MAVELDLAEQEATWTCDDCGTTETVRVEEYDADAAMAALEDARPDFWLEIIPTIAAPNVEPKIRHACPDCAAGSDGELVELAELPEIG